MTPVAEEILYLAYLAWPATTPVAEEILHQAWPATTPESALCPIAVAPLARMPVQRCRVGLNCLS